MNAKDVRSLIARLETKLVLRGFPVSPDDTRKAVEVLANVPEDIDLESLGHILAGVFARDQKTYDEFLSVWRSVVGIAKPQEVELPRELSKAIPSSALIGERLYSTLSVIAQRIARGELSPLSGKAIMKYFTYRVAPTDEWRWEHA